jgi:hypothetical protein
MIEHPSVSPHTEPPTLEALRAVPLAHLADPKHDADRTPVVDRLVDADKSATRVSVSAFGSSI